MDNNPVVIKASKRKFTSAGGEDNDQFMKEIIIKALINGKEVGRLTAMELDLPNTYAVGGIWQVAEILDETSELSQLCEFAFGEWATGLMNAKDNDYKTTYTERFAKLAKLHGYYPPDMELEETDFDYKLLYVERVNVEPTYQRRGIGSMLVQALGRRNWLSKYQGKAIFIALRAYPIEGKCWSFPEDSAEQKALFAQESAEVKSFYQQLGFSSDNSSSWMLHCPNMLYHHTQAKKKALPVACAA